MLRKMAEEGGSRTHQARRTRLTGFEVRAPHRGAILLHAAILWNNTRKRRIGHRR